MKDLYESDLKDPEQTAEHAVEGPESDYVDGDTNYAPVDDNLDPNLEEDSSLGVNDPRLEPR